MSSELPWTAEVTADGATRTVILSGELDFVGGDRLHALLIDELDEPDAVRVVAGLAAVSFLDSAALGVLVRARTTMPSRPTVSSP
jgi:anti-anti-sigma factor